MNLKNSLFAPSPQLLDAVVESYVTWREESAAVRAAYGSWNAAAPHERSLAFDDYVEALDREERAASHYRLQIEKVGAVRGL